MVGTSCYLDASVPRAQGTLLWLETFPWHEVSTTMLDGWRHVHGIVGFCLPPYLHHICYAYIIQYHHAYIMLRGCFSSQGTGNPARIQGIMRKDKYIQFLDENLKNLQKSSNSVTTESSSKTTIQSIPPK